MILLVRADASPQIGTGHLMRCLALAQTWQMRGGSVTFAVHNTLPESLGERVQALGMGLVLLDTQTGSSDDAVQTSRIAGELDTRFVVVDGYQFGADYQRWLKQDGLRLLFIDDYAHADHYAADLVLNQNIQASEALYPSHEADTRFLLGARYALLRQEFWQWRQWNRVIPAVAAKILVTMGGSDPDNITLKIIEALTSIPNIEVRIIVGAGNPFRAQLQAAADQAVFQIEYNVTDMPSCMAWADLAIASAGSTTWELLFMGLPSLLVIAGVDQVGIAERSAQLGLVENLGGHQQLTCSECIRKVQELMLDSQRRRAMSEQARSVVDGQGAFRVVDLLQDVQHEN